MTAAIAFFICLFGFACALIGLGIAYITFDEEFALEVERLNDTEWRDTQ